MSSIGQVEAQDPDDGDNGALQYELADVTGSSSSGAVKFFVDADSGEVRLVGDVTDGETYRLTIKV